MSEQPGLIAQSEMSHNVAMFSAACLLMSKVVQTRMKAMMEGHPSPDVIRHPMSSVT